MVGFNKIVNSKIHENVPYLLDGRKSDETINNVSSANNLTYKRETKNYEN